MEGGGVVGKEGLGCAVGRTCQPCLATLMSL
jgi:hypothetical protein